VLAKANRITVGTDYKQTVRRGSRFVASHTVIYVLRNKEKSLLRFGFIVTKSVGNSVIRNRVRRRLKAASYSVLGRVECSFDVVVRALPASAGASWDTLQEEISRAIEKARFRQ
jgi:ribonuclease P protein component